MENGDSLPCLTLWIFGASLSGRCGGHVTITPPAWYYCLGRTILATSYLLVYMVLLFTSSGSNIKPVYFHKQVPHLMYELEWNRLTKINGLKKSFVMYWECSTENLLLESEGTYF